MKNVIGIDLGTSGVKLLLVSEKGEILSSDTETYPVSYPHDGWSEQDPLLWRRAISCGIKKILEGEDKEDVVAISFGGQMHGLVALDKEGDVIRPCILWNDGRTQKETDYLNNEIGKKNLLERTGNIAFAGFTAPKILWMKNNEPENFARINKILLPKDYIAYWLSGEFGSDYSDASGMLLLDVEHKCWSKEMLEVCGLKEEQLPKLHESYESIGFIRKELAAEFGLPTSCRIVMGAGDNAAAAIGTGTIGDGRCNVSLGTSGTVFISSKKYLYDKEKAIHSFAHADGNYHLMGCILSAASCNAWWVNDVLKSDHAVEQMDLKKYLGKNNVYFLPYLMGERCPHNDVSARGAFIGMRPDTSRGQLTLSVLEGVSFALRDCLDIARDKGLTISGSTVCGGGTKSKLWCKILANVLGVPLTLPKTEQGPSYGAAILALVGASVYPSVEAACNALVAEKETIYPDPELTKLYQEKYEFYDSLYVALKDRFANWR